MFKSLVLGILAARASGVIAAVSSRVAPAVRREALSRGFNRRAAARLRFALAEIDRRGEGDVSAVALATPANMFVGKGPRIAAERGQSTETLPGDIDEGGHGAPHGRQGQVAASRSQLGVAAILARIGVHV